MPKPFRSLASILATRDEPAVPQCATGERAEPAAAVVEERLAPGLAPSAAPPADERIVDLLDTFIAELARLRARAAERFEEQAEAVLAALARHVLARELQTAPAELEVLLARALAEVSGTTAIVVRVCPSDAERLRAQWPVEAEAGLVPGDFAIEIDDGRYDASLQTRLEALLASHRVAL